MNILGLSAYYHDSAACLLRDGKIVAAAQEERFSRIKHDADFPHHAIDYCLSQGQITANELDHVAFYDKPFLKFERILETYLAYAPRGIASFLKSMPLWLKKKLWLRDLIAESLGYAGPISFPEHHESHAASAFFASPFAEAAFLTIDGVGEWTTTSFGVGKGNRLQIWADIAFPHSIGLLYSAFTYYLGFRVNSGEYKVMGLAPYGEPRYRQKILDHLIDLKEDGSFQLDMDYFNYAAGLTMTSAKFHRLFGGEPRRPESELEQRHMDIACSIQAVTEEVMLRLGRTVKKETGQQNLCLAGGVALNCVANGRLLRSGLYQDIWVQPAAGDAGGALGAALLVWHHSLNQPRTIDGKDRMQASLLGPEFSDAAIEAALQAHQLRFQRLPFDRLVAQTVEALAKDRVIGWFQGRMEFGPRALGARSILGNPRSPDMQRRINLKIKFRESFRPFAPAVLRECVGDYFQLDRPSPYMLLVAEIDERQKKRVPEDGQQLRGLEKLHRVRSTIPAVTHVDNSARIQTVDAEENPLFYRLLKAFAEKTRCPVLINTSFNVRGEPIVCSPDDAVRCFLRTDMDGLAIGSFWVDKQEQSAKAIPRATKPVTLD
ncbi:MAG TPA: carbamoyltransferase [bacterium]|jgi:carbamoyltransferase|nr:carbamoyltransferase [bacterium]HNT64636.1 carbamoyltransferase [bacterium]HOX85796.1 carbamoyltransferase [bacterium]HPG45221.1 carbamoyltransferase [bacterium]HPM97463.1 carbamoyltransferase [bacterium]